MQMLKGGLVEGCLHAVGLGLMHCYRFLDSYFKGGSIQFEWSYTRTDFGCLQVVSPCITCASSPSFK
jgi:hypothetical protein